MFSGHTLGRCERGQENLPLPFVRLRTAGRLDALRLWRCVQASGPVWPLRGRPHSKLEFKLKPQNSMPEICPTYIRSLISLHWTPGLPIMFPLPQCLLGCRVSEFPPLPAICERFLVEFRESGEIEFSHGFHPCHGYIRCHALIYYARSTTGTQRATAPHLRRSGPASRQRAYYEPCASAVSRHFRAKSSSTISEAHVRICSLHGKGTPASTRISFHSFTGERSHRCIHEVAARCHVQQR